MSAIGFRVVIPARLGATRLPGKPLLDVEGKPLVVRVLENARRSAATEVVVATDDGRIVEAVEAAGGRAIITSPDHPSGTDRLAEVAAKLGWEDDEIVVNLQGDEPMVPGALLADLAGALHARPRAGIATMATPLRDPALLVDPNVVKVVLDHEGFALYFSRAPIPWLRGTMRSDGAARAELPPWMPCLRHLGLYAYRAGTLKRLTSEAPAPCERAESLEQLRALWLAIPIHVTVLEDAPPQGVDTEEDLARVRRHFSSA